MSLTDSQIDAQRALIQAAANEDAGFEVTIRALILYLDAWKKDKQAWRSVLDNHFNRAESIGGPIIPSIQACHSVWPAFGGSVEGWEAHLNIENSLAVGDGLQLSVFGYGNAKSQAIQDMCQKTLALLLLTDASQVLFQPAQWRVSPNEIINATATFKRIYVEKWLGPSAIGDMRMGDEQPRVQPPPSARARAASSARPQSLYPLSPKQKEERDNRITNLLSMEIAAHGTAWPFELHRGRWRILNELLEPGALRPWVDEHDQFQIIPDFGNPRRWGITMA